MNTLCSEENLEIGALSGDSRGRMKVPGPIGEIVSFTSDRGRRTKRAKDRRGPDSERQSEPQETVPGVQSRRSVFLPRRV